MKPKPRHNNKRKFNVEENSQLQHRNSDILSGLYL